MKTLKHLLRRQAGLIGLLCVISLSFTSCFKDNDDDEVTPPSAYISVINALPGSQPLDFYLDQNRTNNYAINYGQGQDYSTVVAGKRTATFRVSGTQQVVKADTTTLLANRAYTLYLSNTPSNPEFVILPDQLTRPASGTCFIRLVNVSADAPAVDLAIKQGAVLAANKSYKEYSSFVPLQGGFYTLEIRQAGTNNVLYTLNDVGLKNNAVYTIWLQGVSTAIDDTKLTALIQTNTFYQ